MPFSDITTGPAAKNARLAWQHRNPPTSVVQDEPEWRSLPANPASSPSKVMATRWRTLDDRTREVSAETAADYHVIKLVLRNMNCRFSVSGRTVQDGVVAPGMFHVTEPGASSRCLFRGPAETLHLHVPNSLIAECARDHAGVETAVLRSAPVLMRDSSVDRLGRALLATEEVGQPFGSLYADHISMAIVARLLASAQRTGEPPLETGLSKWRLKRAVDYIETCLAKPVSLADIASATGLTRMHFAAQFKLATGLRPHEYLLRRRIERAQEMLVQSERPVVDVALSVGFQTQSHFTTVFKRFVGQPPRTWRRLYGY